MQAEFSYDFGATARHPYPHGLEAVQNRSLVRSYLKRPALQPGGKEGGDP
jgi:hypothetical protein